MCEDHPLIHRWNVSPGQRPTVEALPAGFSKSLCQGYYSLPIAIAAQASKVSQAAVSLDHLT